MDLSNWIADITRSIMLPWQPCTSLASAWNRFPLPYVPSVERSSEMRETWKETSEPRKHLEENRSSSDSAKSETR